MIDKPSNYPLGSLESRTAARAMLERKQADRKKNVIHVSIECIGNEQANRTFEVYAAHQQGKR